MSKINYIRNLSQFEGKSLRKISKITKHSFETVKKYVDMEDFNEKIELKRRKKKESKLDPYKEEIDMWLYADLTAPRKQRHTAQRVYDRLIEKYAKNFDVSLRLVQYYVADKKKELCGKPEGYLPLEHPKGEAQVDFGEAVFIENGIEFKGYYINISYPYSNAGYTQIFRGQNQECLLQGLQNIFEYTGKVPYKIWFDNLSAAVISIGANKERVLVDQFEKFSAHYKFKPVFCNPASGNEKGSVENKVGYHRRNLFVPIPKFNDLNEYNKELLKKYDEDMNRLHYKKEDTINQLFEEEKLKMFELPSIVFIVHRLSTTVTDGYGKFKFEKNTYSTSPQTSSTKIWIKVTSDKVIVLDKDFIEIVRHKRRYGKNEESMEWLPYLNTLAKRPTALKYTGFYNQLPEPWKEFLNHCNYENKKRSLSLLGRMITESAELRTVNIHINAN